jgi:hypothetical protein
MESVLDPPPDETSAWLDRELTALPERYREPVILCLIQERPRAEVAAELGIPEGTLSSRLDTARKRLAERLARHRLPLVFVGLLVPVPAALAAATTSRAADGAIHQLANEVTKAMIPKTKLATAVALGVLMAGGGLLLAAGGGEPPTPQADSHPIALRAAPVPEKKEPPEPAWMKAFREAYTLKEGEYVKRIAPPYIEERKEYMYRVWYREKQTPEEERKAREHLDREKLYLALFLDFDNGKLTRRTCLAATFLAYRPMLQNGENMMNVWDAVTLITGRESPEIVIDPKSVDHPLFSTEERVVESAAIRGVLSVGGDFVTRKDAPLEKLVPQLEKILREECKLDVRLTLKEEEQPVFVVGGTFKPNPPEWRPKKELDVYATEEGLNKEYDNFDSHRTETPNFKTVDSGLYVGSPIDLVRAVGVRVRTRMVWDAPLPTGPRVSWYRHTVRNPTKEQEAADHDPEKVLANVTKQTGLIFKKERRKVQVLYLSAPEKK